MTTSHGPTCGQRHFHWCKCLLVYLVKFTHHALCVFSLQVWIGFCCTFAIDPWGKLASWRRLGEAVYLYIYCICIVYVQLLKVKT